MEVSALKRAGSAGAHGRSPLLRLQSDERLIALTRRGNHHAFETLVGRYQSRLLAFCRHMLASREDAEDVLQEVFAAAFNAILADEREINVRPWLYRIARNRSLNHLRRVQAIGVDSMDIHLSEHGLTTADKVHRREEFRLLMGDVQELPETQRTALLLREIDALSYEQISEAMETTVPSVKSLLVRARVSLAEAAEARTLTCEDVRLELAEVAEGLKRTTSPVRRHVRGCDRCQAFKKQLKATNRALAVMLPVGPLLLLKKTLLAHIGLTAAAGGSGAAATAGGGAAATVGATAGGILQAGAGALATKAVAGLAAAALVTAGAVEVKHVAVDRAPARGAAVAQVAATPHASLAASTTATAPVIAAAPAQTAAPVERDDDADAKAADAKKDADKDGDDATRELAAADPTPTPADPSLLPATVTAPVSQHLSDVTGLPTEVSGLVLVPDVYAPAAGTPSLPPWITAPPTTTTPPASVPAGTATPPPATVPPAGEGTTVPPADTGTTTPPPATEPPADTDDPTTPADPPAGDTPPAGDGPGTTPPADPPATGDPATPPPADTTTPPADTTTTPPAGSDPAADPSATPAP